MYVPRVQTRGIDGTSVNGVADIDMMLAAPECASNQPCHDQ